MSDDLMLSTFYLSLMAVAVFHGTVMLLVFFAVRDAVALLYALLSFSAILITGSIGVALSPYVRVEVAWLQIIQRIGWVLMMLNISILVDIYLAEHNGHLSVIRRITRWWEHVIGYKRTERNYGP